MNNVQQYVLTEKNNLTFSHQSSGITHSHSSLTGSSSSSYPSLNIDVLSLWYSSPGDFIQCHGTICTPMTPRFISLVSTSLVISTWTCYLTVCSSSMLRCLRSTLTYHDQNGTLGLWTSPKLPPLLSSTQLPRIISLSSHSLMPTSLPWPSLYIYMIWLLLLSLSSSPVTNSR